MAQHSTVKNFTIVTTEEQTAGKGQLGNKWASEIGKNLTFSIFTSYKNVLIANQNYLNFAVSLAVFDAIKQLNVPNLSIKWPNDILSANKKLAGILIENTLQKDKIISSVIGIGINVNQTLFSVDLPNATSIKNCINTTTNLDVLLMDLQKKIIFYIDQFQLQKFDSLEEN